MDSKVRELRDQFCTIPWSRLIYNGMYFSPEREFVSHPSCPVIDPPWSD